MRHTYSESASNSEYCGYLGIFNFEKKMFWSLTPWWTVWAPSQKRFLSKVNRKTIYYRAPNGMGWDEKIVPWEKLFVPSHSMR